MQKGLHGITPHSPLKLCLYLLIQIGKLLF